MFTMKKKVTTLAYFLILFTITSLFSQTSSDPAMHLRTSLGEGLMPVGVYYYPEHWDPDLWEKDLRKLSELGFQFTHFAEFAWAKMEPQEGEYDFDWLDEAIELAGKYDLKVIMCTPTPTPPAWLTQKHPEILQVDDNLIQQQHGSRQHILHNHPVYLQYVEKIIRKLAERYGDHPVVAGWQLDNEPHFGIIYDYSTQAQIEFPVWLEKKYGNIDALNQSWGTAFWSQTYNNFAQIPLPSPNWAPQGANPHALMDFHRFTADRLAEGLKFQADLLRQLISPDQWITTNYAYFKFLPASDPYRNRHDLDFTSHTMYLTSGYLSDEGGEEAFRLGSGLELAFSAELAKSMRGYTGIMELQPGQINWGSINPIPKPGAVRMWLWHSFGLNDQFVCAYRFKQPLFGSEQTHKGIIDTDGETVTRGGEEYVETLQEFADLPEQCISTKEPEDRKKRKTAFFWDHDNMADIENHRHHEDFDPWQHTYDYFAALKSMGSEVVFVNEEDVFDPAEFPFMVVPAYQITSLDLIDKWKGYVDKGGNLIISCRTAKKNPDGHLWKAFNQQPLWNLIGAEIREFDHLPAQYKGTVTADNQEYSWYRWGDLLEPRGNTEVLAQYDDQFYKGTPAAVYRDQAKGSVTYIGVWSDNGRLEKDILQKVYQRNDAPVMDLPPYVFVEWRDGFWVAVNYSSQNYDLPLSGNERIIYGSGTLKPGGVTVWCSNQ